MLIRRLVVWGQSVGLLVLGMGMVCAQDPSTGSGQVFPTKPIRMVAPEAGGGGNFIARLIAQGLTDNLGKQVVVDNRGIFAAEILAKASPDGYTLLFYGSTIILLPFLRTHVPFDPIKDFLPITLAVSSPYILVAHPSISVNSVKGLIDLAKSKPGVLNYGSAGSGSSTHLAAALFTSMAGVDIVHVPYRGVGPAFIGLIGGQVQLMFPNAVAAAPHVKSGKLRALAVTSAEPSALLPGLPTIAASGLPGYESIQMYGVFAPAKTPVMTVNQLNREIVKVLNTPDVKDKLLSAGVEPVGSTPEKFASTMKSEMARMGKVIKDNGIRDE